MSKEPNPATTHPNYPNTSCSYANLSLKQFLNRRVRAKWSGRNTGEEEHLSRIQSGEAFHVPPL